MQLIQSASQVSGVGRYPDVAGGKHQMFLANGQGAHTSRISEMLKNVQITTKAIINGMPHQSKTPQKGHTGKNKLASYINAERVGPTKNLQREVEDFYVDLQAQKTQEIIKAPNLVSGIKDRRLSPKARKSKNLHPDIHIVTVDQEKPDSIIIIPALIT
jgi:hypothetical protein